MWEFVVFAENAKVRNGEAQILPNLKIYHHYPSAVKYDWAYLDDKTYYAFGNPYARDFRKMAPRKGVKGSFANYLQTAIRDRIWVTKLAKNRIEIG